MQYVCNTGLLCKWRQIPIEKLCQRHHPVCRHKNAKYEKYWIPLAQIFTARLKRSLKIENIFQTKYFLRGGHLKLGFIDKLVWHFEKLHKFQFNQQRGGRGRFYRLFILEFCDKSQRWTSWKEEIICFEEISQKHTPGTKCKGEKLWKELWLNTSNICLIYVKCITGVI